MSERTPREWCIDPIEIRNALWALADEEQESTVLISPEVFVDRVYYVLRRYFRGYFRRELYEILRSDPEFITAMEEFWRAVNRCPENFEECYPELSERFERIVSIISRIPLGERVIQDTQVRLNSVIMNINNIFNTHNIRFVIDWSRYQPGYYNRPISMNLLASTLALGFGLSMSRSLGFLEFRKGIANIRGRIDAIIPRRKQWHIKKGPAFIVIWDCIKRVASSNASKERVIEDLLNNIIPYLGTAILFTRDVINCVRDNEYVIVSK